MQSAVARQRPAVNGSITHDLLDQSDRLRRVRLVKEEHGVDVWEPFGVLSRHMYGVLDLVHYGVVCNSTVDLEPWQKEMNHLCPISARRYL